ncbi:MAG: hypothetical protein R3B57_15015 [Phycisphaerales bacterium]
MYPIPPDFDLSPLVGNTVTYLGVDQHCTYLHLDQFNVRIESGYSLLLPDGRTEVWGRAETVPIPLLATVLLGDALTGWSVTDDPSIVLEFSSGATLELFADDPRYECVMIQSVGSGDCLYLI